MIWFLISEIIWLRAHLLFQLWTFSLCIHCKTITKKVCACGFYKKNRVLPTVHYLVYLYTVMQYTILFTCTRYCSTLSRLLVHGNAVHYHVYLCTVLQYNILFNFTRYCSTISCLLVHGTAVHYHVYLNTVLQYTIMFTCTRYCSTLSCLLVHGTAV